MSTLTTRTLAARLRALTPARVGQGITGVSQQTQELLDFQHAHARARDAVHMQLDAATVATEIEAICGGPIVRLHSQAADRATYLQRPDLGRMLDESSFTKLKNLRLPEGWDLAVVVADGLSALAVERHAAPLLRALWPRLDGWRIAPVCVAVQGRVAIGDAVGELFGAKLCVVLIGERPGLSSPDSLGAYLTWKPRIGRTDAERNCISNIRAEGLSCEQAATHIAFYLHEARRRELTGVALKDDSHLLQKG